MQRALYSIFSTIPLATIGCLIPLSTQAQITPDDTTSTTINQNGNDFVINEGDRVGDNLFHSFNEFSVPTLGSARFNNADTIANIFSRVTGSDISSIDGLLGANSTANLYLINPNGIIFRENASLQLGGSFFASTADSLLFEGNTEFSAVNPQAAPLLEVNIPIGARFRDNPGDINVNGTENNGFGVNNPRLNDNFSLNEGRTLTFLGGNLTFDSGAISIGSSQIELGGLNQVGIVSIESDSSLSFPEGINQSDIFLRNNSFITASDLDSSVTINARNLEIVSGSVIRLLNDSGDGVSSVFDNVVNDIDNIENTEDIGSVGNITLNVSNEILIDRGGIISIREFSPLVDSIRDAGNIEINTNNLKLTSGARISASSEGNGNAGNITINATGNISISGRRGPGNTTPLIREFFELNSGISSQLSGRLPSVGAGGNIDITAENLTLLDGTTINASTEGYGNAGDIQIEVFDTIDLNNGGILSTTSGFGFRSERVTRNAGNINIVTGNLNLNRGGLVSTSTLSEGNAGNIIINAREDITLTDERESPFSTPGVSPGFTPGISEGVGDVGFSSRANISSRVDRSAIGEGGQIDITAANLTLADGTTINASTEGDGNAGDIQIEVSDTVNLNNNSSIISTTNPSYTLEETTTNAGNIGITSKDLNLNQGSLISSSTLGIGNAGNVSITTTNSIFLEGIGESVPDNTVGNRAINAIDFRVNEFATISSQVNINAIGTGGQINIETTDLTLLDGTTIIASTEGRGDAGNIKIDVADTTTLNGGDILSTTSDPSASTEAVDNNAGTIEIVSDNIVLKNGGEINTSTSGSGNAGLIDIQLQSGTFEGLNSGVQSSVLENATGNGGNIEISAESLLLTDNAEIATSTSGEGNAGSIFITETSSLSISNNASITAEANVDGGIAGNLTIESDELNLSSGSLINVSSPEGQAGNISIQSNSVSQNQGFITSETLLDNENIGANINLEIFGNWRIENESLVSATAFGDAEGGNININQNSPDTEFLLFAFPPEGDSGSDIIANAENADGGRIEINAAGIFGIDFRDEQTFLNDLTVSSEFGSPGETIINRTVEDPTSGLINLPASVSDASDQISQNPCQQGVGSEFIVTGKGGLPPSVNQSLNREQTQVGLIELVETRLDTLKDTPADKEVTGRQGENVKQESLPSQGWVFNEKGEVTLTAYRTTDTKIKRSIGKVSDSCSKLRSP